MSGSRLELLPAVDIADGRAVQLVQGVAGTGGEFGDPFDAALAWQDQGAEWLHLVDLDAAFGRGSNRELVDAIVGKLDIQVELSGGIRDAEFPRCRARDRMPPGQPRYGGARAARVDRARPSPSTATGSPSAWTFAGRRSRRAGGPATAATCGRRWRGWTARAAPATS